ncbi:MAG: HAD family hydrolase [Gammaproteobacteria bacterium]|nr:HAD family hydrolase [Gammaproteobacteria bacterium]
MSFRHVILDRDGVLNREPPAGGYVRTPAEFHWLPGALEALALLRRAGLRLSVATNQAGVGRGQMSREQLDAVHGCMRSQAAAAGAPLDEVLVCLHAPEEGCGCRKPAPGLIRAAIAQAGIPAGETILIGDDERDLEAARRAGVAAALVRTGKGRETLVRLSKSVVTAYDDLLEAARAIAGER